MRTIFLPPLVLGALLGVGLAACDDGPAADAPADMSAARDLAPARDAPTTPRDLLGADLASADAGLCVNGVKDPGETDIDCGGPCAPCPTGLACDANTDCTTGFCAKLRCAAPFAMPQKTALPTRPGAVVAGDWNGDKKIDLAFACAGSDDVAVLLGNGDGTFGKPARLATPRGPAAIASADLNADGKLDLLVLVGTDNMAVKNGVDVLVGKGDGTFAAAVNYATGAQPRAVVTADWNVDGKLDVAVLNYYSGDLSVLTGGGDGTLAGARSFTTAGKATGLVTAELSGDKNLDLAVGSADVNLHLGDGTGSFGAAQRVPGANGGDDCPLALGDFDADGKRDLVIGGALSLGVLLGDGAGGFRTQKRPLEDNPNAIVPADLDRDGMIDLVLAGQSSLLVAPGRNVGAFPRVAPVEAGGGPRGVAVADLNGDGKLDLVAPLPQSDAFVVLLNALP